MSRVLTAIGECQSAWQRLHDAKGAVVTMKYRQGRGEATVAEVITAISAESAALVQVQQTAAGLERLIKEIQCVHERNRLRQSGSLSSSSSRGSSAA